VTWAPRGPGNPAPGRAAPAAGGRREPGRARALAAHARASAPGHGYYAAVRDRKNSKRAALSEARKIVRQACHILAELGDDALAA